MSRGSLFILLGRYWETLKLESPHRLPVGKSPHHHCYCHVRDTYYVSKFHQSGHDVSIVNKQLENINILIPSTLYLAWNAPIFFIKICYKQYGDLNFQFLIN
jgi:hypothetical protein